MTIEIRCPTCGSDFQITITKNYKNPTPKTSDSRYFVCREVMQKYCHEQRASGAWSKAWADPAEAQLKKFLESGFPLDRAGVADFRAMLLEENKAPKTVNTYLTTLSGFCRLLVNRGDLQSNPCLNQALRRGHAAVADQRLTFTPEEVGAILKYVQKHAPITGWAGFVWAMAYTGARNEEVAQLQFKDMRVHEGIRIFDMADMQGGQTRKNPASLRLLPVHSMLLNVLPTMVRQSLQNGAGDDSRNLWSLRADSNGKWNTRASRWFSESVLWSLKKQGKVRDDKRLTLYSLRHAVLSQLKHKGFEESLIAELAGHSNGNITTGRYGKKYPVELLVPVVEAIQWPI